MNRRPSKSRSDYDSFSSKHTERFTASSPDTHFFEPARKRPLNQKIAFFLLLILLLLLAANFTVNQFIHVARVEIPIKGLSEAFDGYTILHISDLKGRRFGGDQQLLSFALGDEEYDMVLLTGDMVSSLGNAQPLYALIEKLQEMNSSAPIYFIAGDSDPTPASMSYASGGSPFAPWVLGAQQRGAQLLSVPQRIERDGQTIWLTTPANLTLDLDAMYEQYAQQYFAAQKSGDDNEIELATFNVGALEETRAARKAIKEEDILLTASHAPLSSQELSASSASLISQVDLILCGHYLGGLIRLPLLGALFIPSQNLPFYGLFPGQSTHYGLSREGRTWVYTSPGLGSGDSHYPAFFFRLFNPPTVTLVSLTPSSM